MTDPDYLRTLAEMIARVAPVNGEIVLRIDAKAARGLVEQLRDIADRAEEPKRCA